MKQADQFKNLPVKQQKAVRDKKKTLIAAVKDQQDASRQRKHNQ